MTETQTTARPPVTIGQVVGTAEAALTRLLAGVLAETGTPRETYLAFQRLSFLGGAPAMDAFVLDLSDALALDETSATELAGSLQTAGLIHDLERDATGGRVVELTAAGAALQDRIRRSVGRVTAELVAPFDASDIEATIRTLQAVTERAQQMRLARAAAAADRADPLRREQAGRGWRYAKVRR
jgi:DNA-binding MarR family transcriptional regulator